MPTKGPAESQEAFDKRVNEIERGLGKKCAILKDNGTPERDLLRTCMAFSTACMTKPETLEEESKKE